MPPSSAFFGSRSRWIPQTLTAYPQFTSVTLDGLNTGTTIYHALQARFQKRMTHGLDVIGTGAGGHAFVVKQEIYLALGGAAFGAWLVLTPGQRTTAAIIHAPGFRFKMYLIAASSPGMPVYFSSITATP